VGRKRSKDEDARHEYIPKKTPPIRSGGSGTCDRCGASVPLRADNGQPMLHYDARVPNAHVTLTYCK
jgi:hypothetical protein